MRKHSIYGVHTYIKGCTSSYRVYTTLYCEPYNVCSEIQYTPFSLITPHNISRTVCIRLNVV